MIRQVKQMLLIALCATLFACKKNTSNNPPVVEQPTGTWLIYNGQANWSGLISPVNGIPAGSVEVASLKGGYQVGYSAGGRVFGKSIYKLNNNTKAGIQRFTIDDAGKVVEAGFLQVDNTPEVNFHISTAEKGYYWDLSRGGLKIQTFNPTTMVRTGEIDLSSLSKGASYEAAGQLIIAEKEGKLFVDVQYGTKTQAWQIEPNDQNVYIAVIDIATQKYESTTQYPKAANLGLFSDHPLWNVDAVTGDLYMVAISNMRTQDPGSKILRIKKGQTTFDASFELSIKDYQYPSDFNALFAHDGKIYTKISSRAAGYYSGGLHGVNYRNDIWYWTSIDVATKKATRLAIPVDNFYCYQQPMLVDGKIYFISNNAQDNFSGLYELDPKTGATKETFHLTNSGKLMGVNKLQ